MGEEGHLTRREYREQQENAKQKAEGQSFEERDADNFDDDQSDETDQVSRHEQLSIDHDTAEEEKTKRLKKKLNRVIIGLLIAIIIVYLVLFFVG